MDDKREGIEAAEMRLLRPVVEVSLREGIRSEDIRQNLRIVDIYDSVLDCRHRWQ
jgi:hypothetical protein